MDELVELPGMLSMPLTVGVVELPFSITELVLEFALPLAAIAVLLWVVSRITKRVVRASRLTEAMQATTARWARRIYQLLWLFSIFLLASRLLGAEMARWIVLAFRALNQPFISSGGTSISVMTLLLVVPVFYAAGWISRVTRQSLEQGITRHLNLDPARAFSLLTVTRFSVMVLTVVIGLSIIGINLSSLAVLFGVLGIGLGFGLQDVVANSFAGLIIVLTRPIKEGDRILVGNIEGTVQQIKFIHTVVNTVVNETLIIPNSEITGNAMHNYSYDDISILLCNTVQVSYNSDLDHVGEVLMEVGRRSPYVVPGEEPRYRVVSFDDSGITVRLCTWIRDARERIPASSWNNLEIWRAFRKNGIEIPFPQVDLHVRSGNVVAADGTSASAVRNSRLSTEQTGATGATTTPPSDESAPPVD